MSDLTKPTFRSAKTYGHDAGFSCAFRQHRADSHCHFVHGYALKIRVEWAAVHLDDRNWVVDFGGLKDFKQRLAEIFDHKTVVAYDDPHMDWFQQAAALGVLELVTVPKVGCEAFALMVMDLADHWTHRQEALKGRVRVARVEVHEHGGNMAAAERA